MEPKTKIDAEDDKQQLQIIRDFDLPLELLFRAYTEPDLLEQWMGTKVLELKSQPQGSYRFETTDLQGNKYRFHGVIHEFIPNRKITRTFEMMNMPFGVQLELYSFISITEGTSKLQAQLIYESVAQRDQMLKMGMTQGINMAHNRLQEVVGKLK